MDSAMNQVEKWEIQIIIDGKRSIKFKSTKIKLTEEDFIVSFINNIHLNDNQNKNVIVSFQEYPIVSLDIDDLYKCHKTTKGADTLLEFKINGKASFKMNKEDLKKSLLDLGLLDKQVEL